MGHTRRPRRQNQLSAVNRSDVGKKTQAIKKQDKGKKGTGRPEYGWGRVAGEEATRRSDSRPGCDTRPGLYGLALRLFNHGDIQEKQPV